VGIFDGLEGFPRSAPMDHLGLVKAVYGLGQGPLDFAQDRIVLAVADAPDRWFDAGFGKGSVYLIDT
jgi:hypothetical protein